MAHSLTCAPNLAGIARPTPMLLRLGDRYLHRAHGNARIAPCTALIFAFRQVLIETRRNRAVRWTRNAGGF